MFRFATFLALALATSPAILASHDPTLANCGAVVQDLGWGYVAHDHDGTIVTYFESNAIPGLQRGGVSLLGDALDPCQESKWPDSFYSAGAVGSPPNPFPPPECGDGIDNDNDGQADWPNDPDCGSPASWSESPSPPTYVPLANFMACYPETGDAMVINVGLGSATSGTRKIAATGDHAGYGSPDAPCLFEVVVRTQDMTFTGASASTSLGGATVIDQQPCKADFVGDSCTAEATFTWWRTPTSACFDVPFDLLVNGNVVDSAYFHFCDPPLWDETLGNAAAA